MYSGYGTAFDVVGWWKFDYDFARNVIIFGVDSSSSSHSDNCKDNFLVLYEEPTCDSVGTSEQNFSIKFTKAKTKFCLSLHLNGHNSYSFVNRKKSMNLKLIMKIEIFSDDFV